MTSVAGLSNEDGRVSGWRRALGESTRLWAGGGTHFVGDGWWIALSGVKSVDYNVVCWHSADPPIGEGLGLIQTAKVPALQMLAGPALAAAQQLADEEWVCIGAVPFMRLESLADAHDDPDVGLVAGPGITVVQDAVARTFDVTAQLAATAVPRPSTVVPGFKAWALTSGGELQSCVATVRVGDAVVVWSMATPPALQRRGFGGRLLSAVLARSAAEGCDSSLLYASPAGEALYRSLGYEIIEHWQAWSRPRWVLGRA
jgi:GNAT superfamily N-acetyltransferase